MRAAHVWREKRALLLGAFVKGMAERPQLYILAWNGMSCELGKMRASAFILCSKMKPMKVERIKRYKDKINVIMRRSGNISEWIREYGEEDFL